MRQRQGHDAGYQAGRADLAAHARDAARRAVAAWLAVRRRHGRDSAEDRAAEAAYLLLQAQDAATAWGIGDLERGRRVVAMPPLDDLVATLPPLLGDLVAALREEIRRGMAEIDGCRAAVERLLPALETARDPVPTLAALAAAVEDLRRTTADWAASLLLLAAALAEAQGSVTGIAALVRG